MVVEVVQDEFVVLELVQDDVDNGGLYDAEGREEEEVYLDDLDILLCDVLSDGVVEDGVIQDVEDVVDVVVEFEDGMFVVKLWEDEVNEDEWKLFVIKLLEDDVEVVEVLEDVVGVYAVGAPDVVDDL